MLHIENLNQLISLCDIPLRTDIVKTSKGLLFDGRLIILNNLFDIIFSQLHYFVKIITFIFACIVDSIILLYFECIEI